MNGIFESADSSYSENTLNTRSTSYSWTPDERVYLYILAKRLVGVTIFEWTSEGHNFLQVFFCTCWM